jgi:hypothetical protein
MNRSKKGHIMTKIIEPTQLEGNQILLFQVTKNDQLSSFWEGSTGNYYGKA